jgi:hypothetical protein
MTRYCIQTGTIPTEGPRSSSRDQLRPYFSSQSPHLFPDDSLRMQFPEWLWLPNAADELSYIIFYGQTKHVLCWRVRSTSTTITSGHGIISYCPRTWVSIQRQHLVCNHRGHCHGLLSADCWKLLYRGCLRVRQMLRFAHDVVPLHRGQDVR